MHEDFKADIKLEGRDVDFNMSGEEIESGIEEPLVMCFVFAFYI
jgi:hypothetical protein